MLAGNKGFAKLAISAQLTLGEYLNYVVVLFFFPFFPLDAHLSVW